MRQLIVFLSATELIELCGRKRSSSQIRWLSSNGTMTESYIARRSVTKVRPIR